MTLKVPHTKSEVGKCGFRYYAPYYWNKLQHGLKTLIPLRDFKTLLAQVANKTRDCFNYFCSIQYAFE